MKYLLTPLALLCVNAFACPGDAKEAMAAAEHAAPKASVVAKATPAKAVGAAAAAATAKPQTKAAAKTAADMRQTASL
jgi:hypothetical protein